MKLLLSTVALIGLFIFSYFYNHQKNNLDIYSYPLITKSNSTITLGELISNKKITILYFGFLSCPEACPTTLSTMASTIKQMSADELKHVEFLFIDLDPERDSLEDIIHYTEYFSDKIIPVSISLNDLPRFTKKFGIVYEKINMESKLDYTIEHTVDVIVIDHNGKMQEPIHSSSPRVVYYNRILELIKSKEEK